MVQLPAGSWHWILAGTSSLVTWSLYKINSVLHLISMASILLWSSAAKGHVSQAYRKMDVTRKRISRILESKLVSALSMLLLSVLSWRVSLKYT